MDKKKIIIITGIIILLIAIIAIIISINSKKTDEIVLKTHGGVSYIWEYTIENASIIEYKEKESLEKRHNVVGGEIEEHYIFKGLKEGTTTITFDYRNFIDNTITQTKKYKVKVYKNLEIDIKEIK